jgi:hypothetical protein
VTTPALAALLLLALDWFPRGLAPLDTGAPLPNAGACGGCHARSHAEWVVSRHGRAWTNPIFQREYKDKPMEWCVHCHAPLREQLAEVRAGGGPLADEGVTCTACHLRGGRMQARAKAPGSPHDTEARSDFGGPAYCGGCHQFDFPIVETGADGKPFVARYSGRPMQDTIRQHAAGLRAGQECVSCHMRGALTGGSTGHRFPGGHDAALVSRAFTVERCRERAALRVTLTNTGAGHNVPTGDLHRHLVLRAWRAAAPERLSEITLGRRFEGDDAGGKRTVADTTLKAGERRQLRLPVADLGGDAQDPIKLELRLVYTIDEFPFRGRELSEPTYVTMFQDESRLDYVPKCVR